MKVSKEIFEKLLHEKITDQEYQILLKGYQEWLIESDMIFFGNVEVTSVAWYLDSINHKRVA